MLTKLTDSGEAIPEQPALQRTTLSVDVLGRYICSTLQEATTNPDFDVVVIGSGKYGAYCASKIYRLSKSELEKPLRVLVLEAGPFLIPEHGQNIPDIGLNAPGPSLPENVPAAGREVVWGTGWRSNEVFPGLAYCVGGKSLFWGGWSPKLTPEDLSLWPEGVREYLNKRYPDVEEEIGVIPGDDFIFDPALKPMAIEKDMGCKEVQMERGEVGLNEAISERLKAAIQKLRQENPAFTQRLDVEPAPLAVQTQSPISGLFSTDKYSSLPGLISAIREDGGSNGFDDSSRNIFVVPLAHVVRLHCKNTSEGKTQIVDRIEIVYNGKTQFIQLKDGASVVTALSTIESTRLALESFPTSPLLRQQEIMGGNLMVHLRFNFFCRVKKEKFQAFVQQNFGGRVLAERLQQAAIHLQGYSQHGRYHLQVLSAVNQHNNPDALFRMVPDLVAARMLKENRDVDTISVVFRSVGEEIGYRDQRPVFTDDGSGNRQFTDGVNSIILAESAGDYDHAFNKPRAYVHFDQNTFYSYPLWKEMYDVTVAIAQEMGANPEEFDKLDRFGFRDPAGSTFHESGTLWIGDDPVHSVTDVNGHFHHVTNAYCADQSLFPTVGSANPVPTGLALSLKVAESIVGRYKSSTLTPDASFTLLFDGTQEGLSSWRFTNGRNMHGRDYHIIGSIIELNSHPGDLAVFYYTGDVYENFELQVEWKAFSSDTNSGIFLRMPVEPPANLMGNDPYYSQCIEVQIDETAKDYREDRTPQAIFGNSFYKTGAIYGLAAATQWAAKAPSKEGTAGFWNTYRITANGAAVSIELNGVQVCSANTNIVNAGYIGFQMHSNKIQFRNIRIRKL